MSTIIKDVNVILGRRGYNQIKQDHHKKIQQWMSYYRGNVDDFHTYKVKTAAGQKTAYRKTMNIAKMIAKDKSTLMFGEGFEIIVSDNQDTLDRILEENNVIDYLPMFYEKVIGYAGYGFMIEYLNDGNLEIDFITGENSYVIGQTNNKIHDILTISETIVGQSVNTRQTYNLLTYHSFKNGVYGIEHELYMSKGKANSLGTRVPLASFEPYVDLEEIQVYNSDVPHFQIIQLREANNHDVDVAYSAPVTAQLLDSYRGTDLAYDMMSKEFELKQPRVIVTTKALETDITDSGNIVQYFDMDNPLYQAVSGTPGDSPITEINTGDFRTTQIIDGINMNLKVASMQAGMGNDRYSFDPKTGMVTATQVISDKSDLFRNMKNDQKIIDTALKQCVKAISNQLNISFGDVLIMWDDSIIVDDEAAREADNALMINGALSKTTMLMKHRGLTEDEALEELIRVAKEAQLGISSFGAQPNIPEETPIVDEVNIELETE